MDIQGRRQSSNIEDRRGMSPVRTGVGLSVGGVLLLIVLSMLGVDVRPFLGPLALVAMVAFFGALYPDTFLTKSNLVDNILQQVTFVAIVASVQTVVMVVGEFDLSVGGLAALATGYAATILNTATIDGVPKQAGSLALAVFLCVLAGVIGGLDSGETGPPEMLMELVYRLATETSPIVTEIRNNVYVSVTPVAGPNVEHGLLTMPRMPQPHASARRGCFENMRVE